MKLGFYRSIGGLPDPPPPPAPVYKGARGDEAAGQGGRAKGGVLLPPGVGLPSFLVGIGEGGEEEEEGKERGGVAPLPLSYSD